MARSRRELRDSGEIWPGFVDALSTLLLVIIFLLVVFVLGQFFLNQMLEGSDARLEELESEVIDLEDRLSIERQENTDLRRSMARLSSDLQVAMADRDDFSQMLGQTETEREEALQRLTRVEEEQLLLSRTLDEMRLEAEDRTAQIGDLETALDDARRSISVDKETIELQLAQLVSLRRDIETLQQARSDLEGEMAEIAALLNETATDRDALREARERLLAELGSERDRSQALDAELAAQREMTVLAQRDLEDRQVRIDELLRSSAETTVEIETERVRATAAEDEVRVLSQQINALRVQLAGLGEALEVKQREIDSQNLAISDLGRRLNVALASKVEELSRFRSDFFGRLREVLGDRADIRIVGDRFVFQSEVLFPTGQAQITAVGRDELAQLADALIGIADEIPADIPWVLQVNGHTDKRPINTFRFASNWELSTARAISVARFLEQQGIPPQRLAAAGFAEFQPLDDRDTEEAFRRNRRIEIKLTAR